MNNIELTLSKVEDELKSDNVTQAKTLIDIYRNLLYQFNRDGWNSDLKKFHNDLLKHRLNLINLQKLSNDKLRTYLDTIEYRKAHAITIALQKIDESIHIINSTIEKVEDILRSEGRLNKN